MIEINIKREQGEELVSLLRRNRREFQSLNVKEAVVHHDLLRLQQYQIGFFESRDFVKQTLHGTIEKSLRKVNVGCNLLVNVCKVFISQVCTVDNDMSIVVSLQKSISLIGFSLNA